MPFRYGIATMTGVPQVFVRLWVEMEGREWLGVAADLLPPKWFTKVPAKPLEEEIDEMRRVIRQALSMAIGLQGESAFRVWRHLYEAQSAWGKAERIPPLLCHFGTSLVERALIEAVCRASSKTFSQMLHVNLLGISLGEIHPALGGAAPADFLAAAPLSHIVVRHTVGLADPLTDSDIGPGERLDDGLPQSLAASIRCYGLRHFKIKLTGDLPQDIERLSRIFLVIQQHAPPHFAFSLDGNEQFQSLAEFRAFWEALTRHLALREFWEKHLLFVEQPLHRETALEPEVGPALQKWPERPPLIIDESDASLEDLPSALRLGYAGTSHKNCKGVFKGIANRCLLLQAGQNSNLSSNSSAADASPWSVVSHNSARRLAPAVPSKTLMSGEDLCNVGPVALLQDLAVMAALGIRSVERNGHHYHAGLSLFPERIQQQVLAHHPDLYQRSRAGWPTLRIAEGEIGLGSVNGSPFGVGFLLDVEQFSPVA
jgi:hypothetical protein